MKSLVWSLLFLVGLMNQAMSQGEEPIILLSSTAKVLYLSPNSLKAVEVFPGALLRMDGKIAVKGKGIATLQFKKHLEHVQDKSFTSLNSVFDQNLRTLNTGMANTFTTAVENAFLIAYFSPDDGSSAWGELRTQKGMGDGWGIKGDTRDTTLTTSPGGNTGDGWGIKGDTRDTTITASPGGRTGDGWGIKGDTRDTTITAPPGGNTGDGWGIKGDTRDTSLTTSPGGRTGDGWGIKGKPGGGDGWGIKDKPVSTSDGWGKNGAPLVASFPYGFLSPGVREFSWHGVGGKAQYVVEVLNEEGRPVAKGTTNKTALTLSLDSGLFEVGKSYTWSVRTVGTPTKQSNSLTFYIRSEKDKENIRNKPVSSSLYASQLADVQALMRAVAYEEAAWHADAIAAYQMAIQLQGKKSNSARLLYAAYWERQQLKQQALSALSSR